MYPSFGLPNSHLTDWRNNKNLFRNVLFTPAPKHHLTLSAPRTSPSTVPYDGPQLTRGSAPRRSRFIAHPTQADPEHITFQQITLRLIIRRCNKRLPLSPVFPAACQQLESQSSTGAFQLVVSDRPGRGCILSSPPSDCPCVANRFVQPSRKTRPFLET